MRLFVECTYVFDHPHVNSGIQRVVRNVIQHLPAAAAGQAVEAIPVVLKEERLLAVKSLAPLRRERWLYALRASLERRRAAYWQAWQALEARLALARAPRLHFLAVLAVRGGALLWLLPHVLLMLLCAPGSVHAYLKPSYQRLEAGYWQFQEHLGRRLGLARLPWLQALARQLAWLLSLGFVLPWAVIRRLAHKSGEGEGLRTRALEAQPGDVLVLLDASWNLDFFPQVERLRQQGVRVVSVVYDLIPILHGEFYDAPLIASFTRWFEWISRHADGYLCISASVCADVRAQLTLRLGAQAAGARWLGHFPLGSELDLVRPGARVRRELQTLLAPAPDGRPAAVYLMVSTIEPRKNHAYLLDAFETLWAAEPQSAARLLIVGRIGWKCAALVARIRHHAEFGKRLFMINDAQDDELDHCYRHSKALVFPSITEGFGLPLVEAMQRGLPAMASDIAVFREVGSDFLAYFDLAQPASLASLISRFEMSGEFPAARPLADWAWPGWQAATSVFVERLREFAQQSAAASSLPASVASDATDTSDTGAGRCTEARSQTPTSRVA